MAFWNKSKESASEPAAQPAPPASSPAPPPPAAQATAPAEQTAAAPAEAAKGQPSLNSQLAASLGKVVSVLMFSDRYQNLTLKDLTNLILPPLTMNQFVVAEARPQGQDVTAPIGLLLWAKLSDDLDRKFTADAGIPTKLSGPEWNSGENIWIIETVGPPNVVEAMIKQLVEGPLRGKVFKFRTRGADGNFRVEVIDPNAAQPA